MKVAFDARSLSSPTPRGWDRYLLELLARLPHHGVEPYLLFEDGKPISTKHALADHPRIPIAATWGLEWEQVALPRALHRLGVEVYHAPAERGIPFAAPCPTLLTLHSLTHHSYRSLVAQRLLTGTVQDYLGRSADGRAFYEVYAEAQFRAADHIAVPSEFCREELLSLLGIASSKVTVTRLGLPQTFMQPHDSERISRVLEQFGIRQPYVLYVGGYERHKNVAGLLEVARLARAQAANLSFVLVGTGEPPEALRQHLGADSSVHFLSNLTAELVPLYDGASLMLTMSWRESFCLPALEAMSRGVPVVASYWGAAREILGDLGALVDPRDPEAATGAALKLLSNPPDAEALRQRARSFTWDSAVERTAELYRSLRERWVGASKARMLATRARGFIRTGARRFSLERQ